MQFIDLKTQYKKIEDKINQRIQTVLNHGQYILGPEVVELEERLAEFCDVKECIGVSNGTDALWIALKALNVGPGDEVILPAFTFFATIEVVRLLGAMPVLVDIEPDTFNIDPDLMADAISEKTKAIIAVSLYGQCANLKKINELARQYDLPVIDDAAQSFGAKHHGQTSCGLTTIGCTSFFPAKPLGAYGDAGACFTSDPDLATLMRQLRHHGQDKRYSHAHYGTNARLDTIQAAILIEKLNIYPEEMQLRQEKADYYNELLSDRFKIPYIESFNESVWAQYTIQTEDRQQHAQKLKEADIPVAIHYPTPLHLQVACQDLGLEEGAFPVTEKMCKRVLSLPMHPYLAKEDQEKIAKVLLEA